MQFLALAGTEGASDGSDAAQPKSPRKRGMSRVERQVLGSNPLLEAFGNAKTLRNDNSSRFGKYIELQFSAPKWTDGEAQRSNPRLTGARIRTYLLEKVRVIGQQEGERNFHIFYQALAAADRPAKSQRGLTSFEGRGDEAVDLSGFAGRSAASFAYLRGSGGVLRMLQSVEEVEGFEASLSAMRAVGLSTPEVSNIFRMLSAVLHLGNITFISLDGESCKVSAAAESDCGDGDKAPLDLVCDMLGIQGSDLHSALVSRTMQAPGEKQLIRMPNNADKAAASRDALARHLYHAVFEHLVHVTNKSIGFQEQATFCGVLDIFGFEFFETNSFEQLCINYTNELLQQYFNTFIFENETALYREEGIDWEPEDFPDNRLIVDLLQERLHGILPMLEEECFHVGGSSEALCNKLVKLHEFHPNFGQELLKKGVFTVTHFAGPVSYTVDGFLDKNKDQLSPDLLQCLKSSTRSLVRDLFLEHDRVFGSSSETSSAKTPGASPRGSQPVMRAKRYSVSAEFRQQLQELLSQIGNTVPHFVRCIKPNTQKQPDLFDRRSVAQQLSYQGVLAAIRVARAGFPVRFAHADFLGEFRCLSRQLLRARLQAAMQAAMRVASEKSGVGETPKEKEALTAVEQEAMTAVEVLLASPELQELLSEDRGGSSTSKRGGGCSWALGRRRIFLKQDPYHALRSARARLRHKAASCIQASQRRRAASAAYQRLLYGILRLQALARGAHARRELLCWRRAKAATLLEAGLRSLAARLRLCRALRAVLAAQSWFRQRQCRLRFLVHRARLVQLQRWWRSLRKRRRWRNLQQKVVQLQAAWRASRGRRQAILMKADMHWRRLAVRRLVRTRREILRKRAWRAEVMANYQPKHARSLRTSESEPSRRGDLLRELLALRQQCEDQKEEVCRLRAGNNQWRARIEELKGFACLRFRTLIQAR